MDIVIGNKYFEELCNLDIDISKKLNGEFEVDEIVGTFKNYFFNRMFLDITAIKNYRDIYNLERLSANFNMDKIIILLDKDDSISSSSMFLSKLVSAGIYNFTSDSGNLMYLYNNPNTYKEVEHYVVKEEVADDVNINLNNGKRGKRVIGIKNVTTDAGATTLCYLFKKYLSKKYKVLLIEIEKKDFEFFKDDTAIVINDGELSDIINSDKYEDIEIFIVDLNKSIRYSFCTDVLFLLEPSTIKLNKLVIMEPNIFNELKGKKIVINKVKLSDMDIANFEVESDLKVYCNIGALNDREDVSNELNPLFRKLGLVKAEEEKDGKGFLGLFKK